MTTISKFYLLDATTPNTGTMPSGGFIRTDTTFTSNDQNGDEASALTARDATDVAGASQQTSTITATANTTSQSWGHRRFVSRPLAAHTFATADGSWTFSYARSESSLNHNQIVKCAVYCWRPSTGAAIGTFGATNDAVVMVGSEPTSAGAQQAEAVTASWGHSTTIVDGDILVFEVYTVFTQSMGTAYTDSFFYNGATEASTTDCASFVTPPAALTLFTGAAEVIPDLIMAPPR